jgi:hypothetical protein
MSNKNCSVLQQMPKTLASWWNAFSIPAEHVVMNCLEFFQVNKVICDFYLWGSLKGKACKTKPHIWNNYENDTRREDSTQTMRT